MNFFRKLNVPTVTVILLPLAILLSLLAPNRLSILAMGTLAGVGIGYTIMLRREYLDMNVSYLRKTVRYLAGFLILRVAKLFLEKIALEGIVFIFINYGILGLFATFTIPEFLKRIEHRIHNTQK